MQNRAPPFLLSKQSLRLTCNSFCIPSQSLILFSVIPLSNCIIMYTHEHWPWSSCYVFGQLTTKWQISSVLQSIKFWGHSPCNTWSTYLMKQALPMANWQFETVQSLQLMLSLTMVKNMAKITFLYVWLLFLTLHSTKAASPGLKPNLHWNQPTLLWQKFRALPVVFPFSNCS